MRKLLLLIPLLFSLQVLGASSGDIYTQSIRDGAITNAEVNASAAIAYSKLNLASSLLQSDMAASVLRYVDLNLTAAQQDSLNATPITAIAAPGSGYITQVMSATCFIDFVATRNEAGSGVLSFRYTDGSGVKATADVPNATYELNSDTYYIAVGASGVPVANAVIVAAIDADVTSGDSLVNCRLYYRTVQVSDI